MVAPSIPFQDSECKVKILVAVDDSPHSEAAIQVVLCRDWPPDSSLKVVCVVEGADPIGPGPHKERARLRELVQRESIEAGERLVKDVAERLAPRFGEGNVCFEVLSGYPKEMIVDAATEWGADLIVVGSHGRRGLARFILGSVSQTVLLHGPCSTLIVRLSHPEITDLDMRLRHILVPIDDSDHSRDALDWVKALPFTDKTCIKLLTILPPLVDKYSNGIDALYAQNFPSKLARKKDAAKQLLAQAAESLSRRAKLGNVTFEVRQGDPAEEILKVAAEWPSGLIVMGSHGHSHMARLWLGSVSQEVVLQAPCPVEVVRNFERGE